MENVPLRDDDWSPPPTADSATPFNQADPSLLTPNRRAFDAGDVTPDFQHSEKYFSSIYPKLVGLGLDSPRSLKPLFRGFERPSVARIAILTVLCLITYPAFYILTLVAKDKSLFIVRLIVAMWCSGIGFSLGYVLLRIGIQHLEAASE
jgi:hypothetical protein